FTKALLLLFTDSTVAVYAATSRGRIQLIYGGQPFIFEKILKLSTGEEKKFWRCNQWWNQKCRSRVFTINDTVIPLQRYHTHEEIVKRKKRARKAPQAKPDLKFDKNKSILTNTASGSIDVAHLNMKYEEIVADVTEIEPSDPLSTIKK
ncbi:uncharacterized protein LOC119677746, partial [Teleopsis dalmanni]|uniref:uncharacterized protein LOC119677746 n=1 Tax=Teleopsis dalmanni TaxID=139649 RepID=UPI0018CCEE62